MPGFAPSASIPTAKTPQISVIHPSLGPPDILLYAPLSVNAQSCPAEGLLRQVEEQSREQQNLKLQTAVQKAVQIIHLRLEQSGSSAELEGEYAGMLNPKHAKHGALQKDDFVLQRPALISIQEAEILAPQTKLLCTWPDWQPGPPLTSPSKPILNARAEPLLAPPLDPLSDLPSGPSEFLDPSINPLLERPHHPAVLLKADFLPAVFLNTSYNFGRCPLSPVTGSPSGSSSVGIEDQSKNNVHIVLSRAATSQLTVSKAALCLACSFVFIALLWLARRRCLSVSHIILLELSWHHHIVDAKRSWLVFTLSST